MNHRENMKHNFEDDEAFKFNEDGLFPCILLFDSLKAHDKEQVAKNIRSWLNSEWKRTGNCKSNLEPFNKTSMVAFSPTSEFHGRYYVCMFAFIYLTFYIFHHSQFPTRTTIRIVPSLSADMGTPCIHCFAVSGSRTSVRKEEDSRH